MNRYKKEFTFDLKVDELKKEFGEKNYSKGYDRLYDFFCNRQGSVYCSTKKMYTHEVFDLVSELKTSCPWLKNCLTRMDVADIGEVHELTKLIKDHRKENIYGKHQTMSMNS